MVAVADDFVGNGQVDRQQLERLLRRQLLAHQQIDVQTGPLDVQLEGEVAVVRFQAVSTGAQAGRWLPDSGRVSQVETHWRRQGPGWQVYRASW